MNLDDMIQMRAKRKALGLTEQGFLVLALLAEGGDILRPSMAKDRLPLTLAEISRAMILLEEAGLAVRRNRPDYDRRCVEVVLTDKGERECRRIGLTKDDAA